MDLKSGTAFWALRDGLPAAFPRLQDDVDCDVAIIGGGITGALIAQAFADAHFDVALLDRRDIGWGSTAASTALLQYEIDTELQALVKRYGEQPALAAYRACEGAIDALQATAAGLAGVQFQRMRSLYVASRGWHRRRVADEGALRRRHGFDVEVLDSAQLAGQYDLRAPLALLSAKAAQVDPYRLTYALLTRLEKRNVRVFDRSEALDWHAGEHGVAIRVAPGLRVHCRHLIVAAGYETQAFLRERVARNHSSYVVVSEPIESDLRWLRNTLFWESARPYLYVRSTSDRRVMVGGEDDRLDIPARRDAVLPQKAARLLRKLARRLPWLPFEPAFAWAGTFAETADGLPYFGAHRQHGPRVLFAMAYGGNGITFSQIGAQILLRTVRGEKHPLAGLFSFARSTR